MNKIRVLIVDDSALIRNIIKEVLSTAENIDVVGEAEDPIIARELIKQLNPDILTLDIEMPKMDGITFLANLMRLRPMPVIMLSSHTKKGADITIQALEIGALDFIEKPSIQELVSTKDSFRELLIEKLNQAVRVDQKKFQLSHNIHKKLAESSDTQLQFKGQHSANHIVAIGASTGGIDAIKIVLEKLPANTPPIVIIQHIPKSFSLSFANRLDNLCHMEVHEASHGKKIKPGHVYIAPGDKHLQVSFKKDAMFCTVTDSAEVNRHKPSVDVLFDSLLDNAANVQAILLTGMGDDGSQGMLRLKQHGARTIIQDESTSLVWGMPGKAHAIHAHTEELPLTSIARSILDYAVLSDDEK